MVATWLRDVLLISCATVLFTVGAIAVLFPAKFQLLFLKCHALIPVILINSWMERYARSRFYIFHVRLCGIGFLAISVLIALFTLILHNS